MKNPVITQATNDVKSELERTAKALRELRDEVRLQMHLGGLEAKHEWSRLEPRLEATLERAAADISEATRRTLVEVTEAVRRLRDTLL
jgi:hypothetical protein